MKTTVLMLVLIMIIAKAPTECLAADWSISVSGGKPYGTTSKIQTTDNILNNAGGPGTYPLPGSSSDLHGKYLALARAEVYLASPRWLGFAGEFSTTSYRFPVQPPDPASLNFNSHLQNITVRDYSISLLALARLPHDRFELYGGSVPSSP